MTSGAGRTITWDAENRVAGVSYGGQTTSFVYGPAGERVKVVVGSATTVYVGDSYEKNLSTGVVTTYYTFGGRRVALRQGASAYWLHPDHLGSTALVTDASGDKAGERRYYPWGALRSPQGGDVHTKRLYTGQLFDESTGLYYYGARYYDVVIGRFISPDTLVPGTGNPQNLNRFSYAANSPTNHTDPSGHCIPGENCPGDSAADHFDSVYYVGIGGIPRNTALWDQMGFTVVDYTHDFGTLATATAPGTTAIFYKAPAISEADANSEAAWESLDPRDFLARTMAQEAPHEDNTTVEQLNVEMVAIGQNANCRVREGGGTLNQVLWNGYALGYDAAAQELYRDPLDDPVERSRFERGLAVSVGLEQGWLYDERTYNKNAMYGYGSYNRYYRWGEETPEQGVKVTEYP